jgi:hypothetical protein
MSPQILYIVITSFIGAFKEYTAVVGLFNGPGTTNGDYSMYTIVYYIYENLSSHTAWAAAAPSSSSSSFLIFTAIQMGLEETGPLLRRKKHMEKKLKYGNFPRSNPKISPSPSMNPEGRWRNDSTPRENWPHHFDRFDLCHHLLLGFVGPLPVLLDDHHFA